MVRFTLFVSIFSLLFLFAFQQSSFADGHEQAKDVHASDVTVRGNVICLLPDHDKGNVKPFIATKPCNGHEPHAHVMLDTRSKVGNVYAVQGSPEAVERLEKGNKKDIEVKGKVSGSQQTGWILTVE